jgi:hypothetical protein
LRVGQMEFILHHGLYGKQDRTVNVVQQIERSEQDQRSARIEFVLGHLGREYNTGKGLNRKARKEYPQRPKNFACSAAFLGALKVKDFYSALLKTVAASVQSPLLKSLPLAESPLLPQPTLDAPSAPRPQECD